MLCDAVNIIIAFTVEKEGRWQKGGVIIEHLNNVSKKDTMNTSQHLSQSSRFRRGKRCTQRDWRLLQSKMPMSERNDYISTLVF
jgi:hypothetical protein